MFVYALITHVIWHVPGPSNVFQTLKSNNLSLA